MKKVRNPHATALIHHKPQVMGKHRKRSRSQRRRDAIEREQRGD